MKWKFWQKINYQREYELLLVAVSEISDAIYEANGSTLDCYCDDWVRDVLVKNGIRVYRE
jgi:hypothetical protein